MRGLASGQDGLITRRQALRLGSSGTAIDSRLRRGEWADLLRGVYLTDADMYGDELPSAIWHRSAALAHPDGVLGLRSAAEVLGLQGLPRSDRADCSAGRDGTPCGRRFCPGQPLEIVLPLTTRRVQAAHVRIHFWPLRPGEITVANALSVTTPVRTLADLVPRLERPHALSVLDSALHLSVATPDELAHARSVAAGRPGCRRVRDLWTIADGGAASPLESRVRLACVDGGVPPDDLQHVVRDRHGILLGIADMAWRARRRDGRLLVAECDGAVPHSRPAALLRDRRRLNDFTSAGCDQLRFTWSDAMRPAYIASVIRGAL